MSEKSVLDNLFPLETVEDCEHHWEWFEVERSGTWWECKKCGAVESKI